MRKTLFWACLLSVQFLFAQEKEGKPNLDPYKNTLKEAKNGNISAIMQIGEICRGHFLATHEVRSFKKALSWFNKVSTEDKDLQAKASQNLFNIYHNGGYGVAKDENQAKNWFNTACQRNQIYRKYYDKTDIYFKDFYNLLQQAEQGDTQAMFLVARHYFEFQINYAKAINYLNNLLKNDANNLDALYLLEKWTAIFKRYRAYQSTQLTEISEFGIMHNHAAKNCRLAKMELAEAAFKNTNPHYKISDNEAVSLLTSFDYKDNYEMEFKRLFLLQRHQKGVARFASIRKMSDLKKNFLGQYESFYADSLFEQLKNIDVQIGSIGNLGEFILKNPDFGSIAFDLAAYRNDFGGRTQALLALQKQFQHQDIRLFAGEQHFAAYQKELEQKISSVLQKAADTSLKLMEFKFALENDKWLNQFYEKYKPLLDEKLQNLGINETNIAIHIEEFLLKDRKFNSLNDVQNYIQGLYSKISDATNRAKLISFAKKKGILDVYGYEPFANKIQELETNLRNTAWLQPEGAAMYFWYTSDSPNWFSGKIDFRNYGYYYEVKRNVGEENFELFIKQIVGKQDAYLAYHSQIRSQISADKKHFEVDIFYSHIKRYKWDVKHSDYVRVFYADQQNRLKSEEFGNIRQFSSHSQSTESQLYTKPNAQEFSEKEAIKAAVRYFIMAYNNALKLN